MNKCETTLENIYREHKNFCFQLEKLNGLIEYGKKLARGERDK